MQPITHTQLALISRLDEALSALLADSTRCVLLTYGSSESGGACPLAKGNDLLPPLTVFSAKGWTLGDEQSVLSHSESSALPRKRVLLSGQEVGCVQLGGPQADGLSGALLTDTVMMVEALLAQHSVQMRYATVRDDTAMLRAQSPSLRLVQQQVSRFARVDLPVQICGSRHQDITSVVGALHKMGSYASDHCVFFDCNKQSASHIFTACRNLLAKRQRAMVFIRDIEALDERDYQQLCDMWFPLYPGQAVRVRVICSVSPCRRHARQICYPWLLLTLPEHEQRQEDHQRFVAALQGLSHRPGAPVSHQQDGSDNEQGDPTSFVPGELLATQILDNRHCTVSKGHKALNEALSMLGESFGHRVTLQQIAAKVFVSPTHLSFLFRKHLGISFKQLLLQIRIARSKQLLRDPDRAITDISHHVGFHDLSHFEKTFRKLVGQNPGAYRGSIRADKRQSEGKA